MPTTIAVAPGRRTSQARRIVAGEPTASKAWSTPPGQRRAPPRPCPPPPAATASRRAARERDGELLRVAVDGDDPPRARQPRGGDDLQPDPAAPDDADASRRWPRVRRCARRRRAVTTPQPSSAACHSGSAARDRDRAGRGHDAALGEARDEVEVLRRARRPGRRSRDVPSSSVPAHACADATSHRLRRPAGARAAGAARRDEAERHRVAGRECADALADRLDDARALVAEHDRLAPLARGGRRRGARRCGRRRPRPRARAPRPRAARRAPPPRPRAARASRAGRRRGSSSDAVRLERVEVGRDAEARPGRRGDGPVGRDLDRRRRPAASRAAPASTPAGRAAPRRTGTSRRRARGAGWPRGRARSSTCAARTRGRTGRRAPAIRRQPPIPPASTTSGWMTSTPPRSDQVARLEQPAHHLARGDPQRGAARAAARSRRRRRCAAAPRASRRRAARARARTASPSPRPSAR